MQSTSKATRIPFLFFGYLTVLFLGLADGQATPGVVIDYKPVYKLTVAWNLDPALTLANLEVQCTEDKTVGNYVKKSDTLTVASVTLIDLSMCINYECRLRDKVKNTDELTFPVRIEPPIPTIDSLTIVQTTQGGFTFQYVPTGNVDEAKCGLVNYSYQVLKDNVVVKTVESAVGTQASINDLFPSTKYTVQVKATLANAGASGPWFKTDVTTFDGKITAPTNLRQFPDIPVTGNDYILTWDPPTNPNGYQIFYKIQAIDEFDSSIKTFDSYEIDKFLDGLGYCSAYSSSVAAGTVPLANAPTIMSPFSSPFKFKTEFPTELEMISNVDAVQTSDTTVQVKFDQQQLLKNNPRCAFTNSVRVYDENGVLLPNYETISKDNIITVNNLAPEKSYGFTVVTKSADGSVVSPEDVNNRKCITLKNGISVPQSQESLQWWHILLIVLAVLLVIGVFLSIIF